MQSSRSTICSILIGLVAAAAPASPDTPGLTLRFDKKRPLRYVHAIGLSRTAAGKTHRVGLTTTLSFLDTGRFHEGRHILSCAVERIKVTETGRKPIDWKPKSPLKLELVVGHQG